MSATRTILLGTVLGLAAGAMTLAQDGAPAPRLQHDATAASAAPTLATGTLSDAVTMSALPRGPALVAVADDILGTRVYDANREWVGEVSALFPAPDAPDPQVVIDIGGFLGFGETPVAVAAGAIALAWTAEGAVAHATVDLTEAELEQMAQTRG